jgi:hypothetical protein
LAWKTPAENEADKVEHGTVALGERHGHSKLTIDQVRRIRSMVSDGNAQSDVAISFGVHQVTVSDIVTGRTWSWTSGAEVCK